MILFCGEYIFGDTSLNNFVGRPSPLLKNSRTCGVGVCAGCCFDDCSSERDTRWWTAGAVAVTAIFLYVSYRARGEKAQKRAEENAQAKHEHAPNRESAKHEQETHLIAPPSPNNRNRRKSSGGYSDICATIIHNLMLNSPNLSPRGHGGATL